MVATFAKVEPFLAELRAANELPEFLQHMEAVVRGMPGAAERTEMLRKQFRSAAGRPIESLTDAEAGQIRKVLAATGGNKSRTAEILGIERKTLYRKLGRMKL